MKAISTTLKNGEIKIVDIPPPQLQKGFLLVQNHYSLISAGTESSTLKTSKKGYIGKAKARPDQFAKVVASLKNQGPIATYRNVMKKLDAYSSMGYSSSGKIIGVGDNVEDFEIGDFVACSGVGYANHAEIISVPTNLCVKLNSDTNLLNASYSSLGGIALQSIRQADLKLGETCAVIGLGLVGQLVGLLLKANGINVIGIDIDDFAVNFSNKYSTDLSINRNDKSILSQIYNFTKSLGVDGVIIAASSTSLDPINFAGSICRDRGRVIVLGDVPTGFNRDDYYRKELILKMSCSYGPGRYDTNYEEKGIDYPIGQVRWTEKRNMEAFQNLIFNNKINIDKLTSFVYELEDFHKPYNLLLSKKKDYFGLVLKYKTHDIKINQSFNISESKVLSSVKIGMIGAGNYAQSKILPYIPKNKNISKNIIITNNGNTSKKVGEKYGFEVCSNNLDLIFNDKNINTVFILTRHDSHANYIIESLKNNKNIFCEKPLCIKKEELPLIMEFASNKNIMIGYNRRFSPMSLSIKSELDSSPMMMLCRINAGFIDESSWIIDPEIGGGRIIGEVCHFIDLFTFFCGNIPTSVSAKKMNNGLKKQSNFSLIINFKNGSIGTIFFTSTGSDKLEKEYYELHQNSNSFVINDFKESKIFKNNKLVLTKKIFQDKGQKKMISAFFENLISNNKNLIPLDEIVAVSKLTFAIQESIKSNGKNVVI